MTERLYFRQLLSGRDFARESLVARQMANFTYVIGDALTRDLQAHVKSVTAPYKNPRVIDYVAELPKTISGKTRRVELRRE